jgi:hypothetical protein
MNFLKLEVGARQAAMGGGGAVLGDDVNADRHNPGGLGLIKNPEVGFLVSSYLQGVTYEHGAVVAPTAIGNLGLQFTQLNYGSFSGYDPNNNYIGSLEAGDTAVGFSYGRTLGAGLSVGGTFRYLQERLDAVRTSGDSFDAGILYRPPVSDPLLSKFSAGITVENFGPSVGYLEQNADLPRQIVCGAALNDYKHVTPYIELHSPNDNNPYVALGAEYWWLNRFAVRAGYRTGSDIGSGVSAGAGIRIGAIQFDYAWIPYGDLGNVSQFGLLYHFGKSEPKVRVMKEPVQDIPPLPLEIETIDDSSLTTSL